VMAAAFEWALGLVAANSVPGDGGRDVDLGFMRLSIESERNRVILRDFVGVGETGIGGMGI
jgi:hypothetical protein